MLTWFPLGVRHLLSARPLVASQELFPEKWYLPKVGWPCSRIPGVCSVVILGHASSYKQQLNALGSQASLSS